MPIAIEKFQNLELSRFVGNTLAETALAFACPQRVLMVTDGSLNFGPAAFGLSEFVGIVQAAGHTVSTAHRSGAAPVTVAGAFNFASAATAVTTANYDQVWLFGFSTNAQALTPAEQNTLAQFMKNGGGVFATGDHATLGQGMGANLPRVRGMRNWASVPMSSTTRIDTVLDPGLDNVKQFNDQANAVAQRTFPVFFSNGGPVNAIGTWAVHPVLRHASGAVDVMPDHAHESECFAPTPVAGVFAGVEEWPAAVGGGARIAPVVVSVSMSSGRFVTDTGKPPVLPRSFGGVSAYDGDAARVGRIVCDSTWHHFVNINLNGSGAGVDTLGNPFNGLYAAGVPTAEYKKIQSYFLNTVRWLAPRARRNCWPFTLALLARFDVEMMEMVLPQPHPCPWDPLLQIGQVAEDALTRHWGPGAAAEVVAELLAAAEAPPSLMAALQPAWARQDDTGIDSKREPNLLPAADLRRVLLGALVNLAALKLPSDAAGLARALKEGRDKLQVELPREALKATLPVLVDHVQRGARQAAGAVEAMLAGR
jgi:hypothetical protein